MQRGFSPFWGKVHNVSLKRSSVKLVQLCFWMDGLNGTDLVRNEHLLILLVSCQLSAAFNKSVWRWHGAISWYVSWKCSDIDTLSNSVSGMRIIIKYTTESLRNPEDEMVLGKRLSLAIISTLNCIITQSKWNPALLVYKYVVLLCHIKSWRVWDCELSSTTSIFKGLDNPWSWAKPFQFFRKLVVWCTVSLDFS